MASLARSLATMASQRRPQPRQVLSRHLKLLCRLHMSLRQTQPRPIRGRCFRLPLAHPIARARPRPMPLLLLPRVKTLQRMQHLQAGLKDIVSSTSQSLSHPSLDVRPSPRSNVLGHYSSKSSTVTAKSMFNTTKLLQTLGSRDEYRKQHFVIPNASQYHKRLAY